MFTLIGAYMKILTAALGWGSFLCFGMLGGKFRLTALAVLGMQSAFGSSDFSFRNYISVGCR